MKCAIYIMEVRDRKLGSKTSKKSERSAKRGASYKEDVNDPKLPDNLFQVISL
jgi:hypothetical protein